MNPITELHSGSKFLHKNILNILVLGFVYDFYSFRLWDKQGKSQHLLHPPCPSAFEGDQQWFVHAACLRRF